MISVLFGKRRGGEIGELRLDATIRETHTSENEVTQFPVEDGTEITDHIRVRPDVVNIDGFVTNSPVNVLQQSKGQVIRKIDGSVEIKDLGRTDVSNKVELAHDILLDISGRKIEGGRVPPKLVTVILGLRVYKEMAIQNLDISRDATTGDALPFSCQLVHVDKVKTETIELPNIQIATNSTVDKNKVNGKDPNAKLIKKSSTLFKVAKTAQSIAREGKLN